MSYSVRKLCYENDCGDITDLLNNYLVDNNLAKDLLEWNFKKRKNAASVGTVLIDQDSNKIVGMINIYERLFLVEGIRVKVGILGDLVVHKKHRALMPALMLLRSVIKNNANEYAFIYGFPNKNAIGLCSRSGSGKLASMTRLAYPLSIKKILNRFIPFSRVCNILDFFYKSISIFIQNILCKYFSKGHNLTIIESFNSQHEELITKSLFLKMKTLLYRNVEYINWRYVNNPKSNFSMFEVRNRKQILRAYVVCEVLDRIVYIRDLIYLKDIDLKFLMRLIKRHFLKADCSSLSIRINDSQDSLNALKRVGFIERETDRTVVLWPKNNLVDSSGKKLNVNNWFLLDGDEDA